MDPQLLGDISRRAVPQCDVRCDANGSKAGHTRAIKTMGSTVRFLYFVG
jgi:hypothetical protein